MPYPPGHDPNELRAQGIRPFEPYDYDATSPGDRELMGIMTLVSFTAFMFAGSYVNAIPAATAVQVDIANVAGGTLSAEVRAQVLEALTATPTTAAERIVLLGGPLTAEQKALATAAILEGPGTMAYVQGEQYIAQMNYLNVIRLAEADALAGSRYLEGLGSYPVIDPDAFGRIGAYFYNGPGGPRYYGGPLDSPWGGGDTTPPGFPGFPGNGPVEFHDGIGSWDCVQVGNTPDGAPPVCHWRY